MSNESTLVALRALLLQGIEAIDNQLTVNRAGQPKTETPFTDQLADSLGYKKDSSGMYHPSESEPVSVMPPKSVTDHVAKSLGDLVTGKQLGMIKALGRTLNIDLRNECKAVMHCNFDELSKRGASQFITHLQELNSQHE